MVTIYLASAIMLLPLADQHITVYIVALVLAFWPGGNITHNGPLLTARHNITVPSKTRLFMTLPVCIPDLWHSRLRSYSLCWPKCYLKLEVVHKFSLFHIGRQIIYFGHFFRQSVQKQVWWLYEKDGWR
jgi:hypothetical protein